MDVIPQIVESFLSAATVADLVRAVVGAFLIGCLAGLLLAHWLPHRAAAATRRAMPRPPHEAFSLDSAYGAAPEGGVVNCQSLWPRARSS